MEKNQEFENSHGMVPKKMIESQGKDERSKIEFDKYLNVLGINKKYLLECFTIISNCESEKFEMMQRIPGGFETWATIAMFIKYKGRVDQMYRRMILRNSSAHVRSDFKHEYAMRVMDGKSEACQSASLSSSILIDKKLSRTRKNLFNAFRAGYYDSQESEVSPSMPMVISNWRGCLEAYRLSLRLDGKHPYPKAVQHGDIFLKILFQECQPKTRGRKSSQQ